MQTSFMMCCRRVTQLRVITAIISAFFAGQAIGQAAGGGSLRGVVSDTRGHAVAGAQVVLYTGAHQEVTASAISDRFGRFEFAHLAPALDYRLRVAGRGYASIEAAGISLQAGGTKQLQITLDPRRALSNAVTEVNSAGVR